MNDFNKWKIELERKAHSKCVLEDIAQLKDIPTIAEQLSYLPHERAAARLQHLHHALERKYTRWLRLSSVVRSSVADSEVLDIFASCLGAIEAAMRIVDKSVQFVASGEAAELFSERDDNTFEMSAATLYECWSVDPTFDCVRYLSRITNQSRRYVVNSLRAYRAYLKNNKETANE